MWLLKTPKLRFQYSHSYLTVAYQVSPSMGFPRQEYWRGLPFPSPGNCPNTGIEPASLISLALAGRFFTTEPPGKPNIFCNSKCNSKL